MQILFKLINKKSLDKGFTTLEVLISIIIALAFVSVTMQSFVLALGMKIQAQEKQRANQLIQEDLERLSDLASLIRADHANKCNPLATTGTGAKTAYENSYAQALWVEIDKVKESDLDTKLNGFKSSKTLKIERTHVYDDSDPSPASDAPYRTLKIRYRVHDSDDTTITDDEVIAQRYVEVIPDVALQCP